jgi:hypothetical protein
MARHWRVKSSTSVRRRALGFRIFPSSSFKDHVVEGLVIHQLFDVAVLFLQQAQTLGILDF